MIQLIGLTSKQTVDAINLVRNPARISDEEKYIAQAVALSILCEKWKKNEYAVLNILKGMFIALLILLAPINGFVLDIDIDIRHRTSRTCTGRTSARRTDYV